MLENTPFRGSTALRQGRISRRALAHCTRLFRDIYLPPGVDPSARHRAIAAWMYSDRAAVMSGWSAAALLGVRYWVDTEPAEMFHDHAGHRVPGLLVHRWTIPEAERCTIGGITLTTPARTAFDLGRRLPTHHPERNYAIKVIDAVLARPFHPEIDTSSAITAREGSPGLRTDVDEVRAVIARHPTAAGTLRLSQRLEWCDPGADSPQETQMRILLIEGGFLRPQTQLPVRDVDGELLLTADAGWEEYKVGLLYQGSHHLDAIQYDFDLRQIARAERAGWRIVQVTAAGLARRTEFLHMVRHELTSATRRLAA